MDIQPTRCCSSLLFHTCSFFFFFNPSPTSEIYTLSLHDALPILLYTTFCCVRCRSGIRNGWSSCGTLDRKCTRLNSSHITISYAVFCLKKKRSGTDVVTLFSTGDVRCAADDRCTPPGHHGPRHQC